ncbi:hypothetical protein Hanom_Chr11g01022301 [Helianthus anomalus]
MAAVDLTSLVALYSCTVTNPARCGGSATGQPRAAVAGSITFEAAFSLFLTFCYCSFRSCFRRTKVNQNLKHSDLLDLIPYIKKITKS